MRYPLWALGVLTCLLLTVRADSDAGMILGTAAIGGGTPNEPCSSPCVQHNYDFTTCASAASACTLSFTGTAQPHSITIMPSYCDNASACTGTSAGVTITSITDGTTGRTCSLIPNTPIEYSSTGYLTHNSIYVCGAGTSSGTFTYTINFSGTVWKAGAFHQEWDNLSSTPVQGVDNNAFYPFVSSGLMTTTGAVSETGQLMLSIFYNIATASQLVIPSSFPSEILLDSITSPGSYLVSYTTNTTFGSQGVMHWSTIDGSNIYGIGSGTALLH